LTCGFHSLRLKILFPPTFFTYAVLMPNYFHLSVTRKLVLDPQKTNALRAILVHPSHPQRSLFIPWLKIHRHPVKN
jgi:hypothetical protein